MHLTNLVNKSQRTSSLLYRASSILHHAQIFPTFYLHFFAIQVLSSPAPFYCTVCYTLYQTCLLIFENMSPQHPISVSLCPPTRPPAASRKRCREESSLSPERDVHYTRRMVELQHRDSQFPDVGDATAPENGLSSLTLGGQEKSRDVGVARGTAYRQLSAKQKHRMMENLRALYPVQFQICDDKVDPARWLKSHEICQRLEAAGLAPITAATMITRHSLHLATPPSHVANLEQQGTAISKALGFDLRLRRQTYVLYLPELEPNNSVSYQNDRAIEQLRADNDNIQVEKLVLRHSMWWLYVGNVKHALQVLDKNRFNARGQLSTVRYVKSFSLHATDSIG